MPKISVITPTYNRAHLIGKAIASVQSQTFGDWEMIIVDDGSTDETRELICAYAEADARIRYIHQANTKSSGARNNGIKNCRGSYVAFLDSDDTFLPGKLARQVAFLESHPDIGLVGCGWDEVDETGKLIRSVCPWQSTPVLNIETLLLQCPFPPTAVLIRTDWLTQVGMFDEQQLYVEDWDVWVRLACAGCKMDWDREVLWRCTLDRSSSGDLQIASNRSNHVEQMIHGTERVLDKFFNQRGLPDHIKARSSAIYANAHMDAVVRCLACGFDKEGQAHLKSALQFDPELAKGSPPGVIITLASAAISNLVPDAEVFAISACSALAAVAPSLARSPRQFKAAIEATRAFEQRNSQQKMNARKSALRALWLDIAWASNRGLLRLLI